jgi:hypothetical protein
MAASLTLCDDGLAHTPICVERTSSCQEVVVPPREDHAMLFSLGAHKFNSANFFEVLKLMVGEQFFCFMYHSIQELDNWGRFGSMLGFFS